MGRKGLTHTGSDDQVLGKGGSGGGGGRDGGVVAAAATGDAESAPLRGWIYCELTSGSIEKATPIYRQATNVTPIVRR